MPSPASNSPQRPSAGLAFLALAALLCIGAVILFLSSGSPAPSVESAAPISPPRNVDPMEHQPRPRADVQAAERPSASAGPSSLANSTKAQAASPLLANTWTWQFEGVEPRTLKFLADGTLLQTRFTGTYEQQGSHRVSIRKAGEAQPAILEFSQDWARFDGKDFDGKRTLWGVRVPPAASFDPPWNLAADPRHDSIAAILCGTEWTWERLGAAVARFGFTQDGKVVHPHFAAEWSITEDDSVVLTAGDGNQALIALDPNLAGWQGTDFDGKRLIWGRAVGPLPSTKNSANQSQEDAPEPPR